MLIPYPPDLWEVSHDFQFEIKIFRLIFKAKHTMSTKKTKRIKQIIVIYSIYFKGLKFRENFREF